MEEQTFDEDGGIILNSRSKDRLLKSIDDIDELVLPSKLISSVESDDVKVKEDKSQSPADEYGAPADEWLSTLMSYEHKPKGKAKKFKGFDLEDKPKKKKNGDKTVKQYDNEFNAELILLKNMSKDHAAFVDSLQKKYNQLDSTKSTARGISKVTTDLIDALTSARATNLAIVKSIIDTKKTVADLNFKEKKEFGVKKVETSDASMYASTFLKQITDAGRQNFMNQDVATNIEDNFDYVESSDELFNILEDGIDNMNSDKSYIDYENMSVTIQVLVEESGEWSMQAVDPDGDIIDNYPAMPNINKLKLNIDRSINKAIDQYGRKYPLVLL